MAFTTKATRLIQGVSGSRISRGLGGQVPRSSYTTTQHQEKPETKHTNDGDIVKPFGASGAQAQERHKTQAELDNELRMKLEAISGEGGEAGVEYEDGNPVAMKRSVKNNMFRVI